MPKNAECWAPCPKCGRTFLTHAVRDLIAYCNDVGGDRAPWGIDVVYGWRLDVGLPVTAGMAARVADELERRGEGSSAK